MLKRMVLAGVAMIILTGSGSATDCPVEGREEGALEAQQDAIREAPTCKAAYQIMEACAYGATGDTALGDALHEKCEPEFLLKLSKAERRAYEREQKHCDDQYARKSGTMYRSFAAFCQAKSTVAYAAKYGGRRR